MPIYEYRCSSCGFQKEYLRKVSDPVMSVCPECNRNTFSKMLSAAGFQLKGSGWYATDFKNSGSKPAAKSEAKDSGAKDSGAGKSESKDAGSSKSDGKSESNSKAAA
ncbi:MAG TPA: zinc ribbon domain-containing protein [Burkholderiales bacterium]|nr:zinc ribbon domain-containing protein [Burkholderiales bacterium]